MFATSHFHPFRAIVQLRVLWFRVGNWRYSSSLTQQEVVAALRPFYFAVHPDLFWQFPNEKAINENSLKILNSYLETLLRNQLPSPTSITFCLRGTENKVKTSSTFKKVNIDLLSKDLRHTVHKILTTCQLPTQYLDGLPIPKPAWKPVRDNYAVNEKGPPRYDPDTTWWTEAEETAADIEQRIRNEPDIDCYSWLNASAKEAQRRLRACQPLRDEAEKLCRELKETLQLEDLIWNCGWGVSHFRGCLLSFRGLTVQHPDEMSVLKGRTVIFGRQSGVSFEGHIILSSEDVRNSWLDVIQSVHQFDSLLHQMPDAEKSLSEALRGISIDHRKFQPTVLVQKYIQQLRKLTTALYTYKWRYGFPESWPRDLEKFQIVVECESGPLMLSPTGQFIVPASCPAFILIDFISKNMVEASHLLDQYTLMKAKESDVYTECMVKLGLSSLEKDDNVTPDLMVKCCNRLLDQASVFQTCLRGLRLRISHYYSILQDGDICIPWDWKQLYS